MLDLGNIQNKAQEAQGKEYGGNFGLGTKSLGSDNET